MAHGNQNSGVEGVSSRPPSSASVSTDAVTQAGAAQSNGGGKADSNTKISSLADLKSKAPEVWQKMLEGIGMKICNEMRHHDDRIKKLRREYERSS